MLGTVYRSEPYGGQTRARIVGGYGGWRQQVSAQGYGSNSGVKLSHILQDAAGACGERVNVAADRSVGPAWTRSGLGAVASDILWQLLSAGVIPAWRVDQSGVTQVTPWPGGAISSQFIVTDQKPDEGLVVIATEDYAAWLPGVTFSAPQIAGSFTSAGVNYVFDNDGTFRLEVLTGGADRFLGALQSFIARQVAPTRYFGRYEYTISNPTETTIDGTPVDDSIGLPELQSVPITSDSISSYIPPSGSKAHIMFVNGSPARPVCVWTEEIPDLTKLSEGTNPAAKLGDTVQSIVSGTCVVLPGSVLAVTGVTLGSATLTVVSGNLILQGTTPISGTITTGSGKVQVPN